MNTPGMMPGQAPYTEAELAQLAQMVSDAAEGDPGEGNEPEPPKLRQGGGKRLRCCCCGGGLIGRQWWNRDTGFGLCRKCIVFVGADVPMGQQTSSYGIRGVHFDIPGTVDE